MNDASVLFSEAGRAIPRSAEDIVFLEDFIYAANYARDPLRKDRGFSAYHWLALNRDIPRASRELARYNLFFYYQPISKLLPSFASRSITFTAPNGYHLSNPSVSRWHDEIVLLQRTVNFTLTGDGQYQTSNGSPIHTRNFLLRRDKKLEIKSSAEILAPTGMPAPAYQEVLGFEDLRLFAW